MECSKTRIERIEELGKMLQAAKPLVHKELAEGKNVKEWLYKRWEEEYALKQATRDDWNLNQKVRFECSVPLGEVAELVDQWYSKQHGIVLKKNPDKYGIDFITEDGMEDTKLCPRKEDQNFFVERWHHQSGNSPWRDSDHFAELAKGKEVFLRFIDLNGCYRIKLSEHTWNPNQLCRTSMNTKGWWVFKETFQKVWEW